MATPLMTRSCVVIRKAQTIARIYTASALIKVILVNETTVMMTAGVTWRMIQKRPITVPITAPGTFFPKGAYGGEYPLTDPAAAALGLGEQNETTIGIHTQPPTDGSSLVKGTEEQHDIEEKELEKYDPEEKDLEDKKPADKQ
ncbi:hypothetical protein DER46DRAFT_568731 [Fusarium sp. MPI-SDFR-AT-0072]|nr:hypothetical protein DER46DRAFT_568731 [Fusarium sp. MPI-SDFR-AT-0072]